jgi:hypothetical protein
MYPYSPKIIATLRRDLENFETTKGTVRFTTGNPLPKSVIDAALELRKTELANSGFKKTQAGIALEQKDPIYDVMSDKELDEANKRINDLLNEN